jgi:hypothetical protein
MALKKAWLPPLTRRDLTADVGISSQLSGVKVYV